jgi:hypothetical protein
MSSGKKNKFNGMYVALAGVGTVAAGYYALGWLRDHYFGGLSASGDGEFNEEVGESAESEYRERGSGDDERNAEEWKELSGLHRHTKGRAGGGDGIEEEDSGHRLRHSSSGGGELDREGGDIFTASRGGVHAGGVSHTIERDGVGYSEDKHPREGMVGAARGSTTRESRHSGRMDDRGSFVTAHSSPPASRREERRGSGSSD